MTDRAEIERLLQMTGRTLEGLPEFYPEEQAIKVFNETVKHGGLWENKLLHQSDVIELLVGALRDALENVPKWIKVEDEKPEPFVSVQVYMPGETPHPTVREGFITKDGVWHAGLFDREPDEVTHWKPMSEPPEVDTHG